MPCASATSKCLALGLRPQGHIESAWHWNPSASARSGGLSPSHVVPGQGDLRRRATAIVTTMATPRWEGDDVGTGVGDAGEFAGAVRALLDAMALPDWVTEDPQIHLLPKLRSAIDAPGSPWRLVDDTVVLAVYLVTLEWTRRDGELRDLREDVFALIGSVAETATHVQQRVVGDRIEFEVTTGTLAADSAFTPHGHTLRLRVVGAAVRRLPL